MSVAADPRLGGVVLGAGAPSTDPTDATRRALEAQFAAVNARIATLEREIRDLRAAGVVQLGAGTPAGLSARDGAPYGQTNATFWLKLPTGWRGVSLPLT
jgi:hypothetical protein